MVGRKVGRFLVLAKLGQGGMATVWKARDELLGRDVALKILDPKLGDSPKVRRRFLHEAQTIARLDHPGAVAVYDSGECDGDVYIAMRWVDGETLSERIAQRLLAIDDALRIVADVAEVLAHAHDRGVIHRDVTSRNIMIGRDGRVFVLDFGLALANWETRVTSSGATLGTVPYMAPEVLLGKEADPRTDLYGLGVVLYESLTGALPHRGEANAATAFAAIHREPIPPRESRSDISEALERVILKAISRDPSARFQSAKEFRAVLTVTGRSAVGAADAEERTQPVPRGDLNLPLRGRPNPLYLAIVPFTWEGASPQPPELLSIGDRLAEAVRCALADGTSVRLVPLLRSENTDGSASAIAVDSGANALLTGSVRHEGATVRVSYAFTNPREGEQWAGGIIDGSMFRLFDLEDRLVSAISKALGCADLRTRSSAKSDPAASERYLQALGYLRRYDMEASVDGAINVLERLVVSDGHVARYHATLSRAYLHKYDYAKDRIWENRAAVECQRARELDADDADVLVAQGALLIRAGRGEEAQAVFEQALERRPGDFDSMLGVARAHMALGRFSEAEPFVSRAVSVAPDDWRGYLVLGRIHFKAGAYDKALESWNRVMELTPDNAMGRRFVASAFYALDRHEEAVTAYRASLAKVPNEEAYSNLGTALYFLGRYDEALEVFRKATDLAPTDPLRWGNLGNACHWLPGHELEANSALDRAILLMREKLDSNPRQAESWARLSGWLSNRGRLQEASTALEQALTLEPENVYCLARAGFLHYRMGHREESLRCFRRARAQGYGTAELRGSRELEELRRDPEFRRLLEEPSPIKS